MDKKIAILLNGPISNDYRVIKMIRVLSKNAQVHLFYINGNLIKDQALFEKVKLHVSKHPDNFKTKLLRHTFFCYEFTYLNEIILNQNIPFDIVWANDLPTLFPAYKVAKKLNAELIYDSHEIYIETINQFFPRNPKPINQFIFSTIIKLMKCHGKRIEKKIVPKVSKFITVNDTILSYFNESYTIANGIVIMNVPEKTDLPQSYIDYRKKYSWKKDDFILLYQGLLNEGRGLQILIESMINVSQHIKLIIIGDGTLKNVLQKFVDKNKLNHQVKFIGLLPLKDLKRYTCGADVGVNLLESFNLSKKMASPNKLFEYIHARIPVLGSNTIENKKVIEKYNIGLLTENSIDNLTKTIVEISKYNLKNFNTNFNEAITEYNWENQHEKISSIIN